MNPDEGWTFPQDARKCHYFAGLRSLCGRYGIFKWDTGRLEPDNGASPDDCTACRRKLDGRNR